MALARAAATSDVPPGTGKVMSVGGKAIALFNVGGTFFALDNRCTHAGGPLGQGKVEGNVVTCPWHGSRFEVTTGRVVGPPARQPVRSYPTKVENGGVFIDV